MPPSSATPPHSLDALLAALREQFGELSAQLQSGARHLLDHPSEVPLLSMRKIAADAGVQPATLVRLAQHLGYDGWQSLRLVFVEALRGGPQPYAQRAQRLVRESGSDRMLETMLQAQHRNLEQTGAANAKALAQAAAILAGASTVHVAGFRSSYPIAFGFHYLYRLFRDSVHLVRGDAGTLEMDLRALKPDDAVLMTSFAPYSQEIVRVAEAARRAGSKVIALSDSVAAPIALKADCTLVFSVDSPSFFPSISAGMALVEALVQQLLAQEGKGAIKTLKQAEEQLHRSGAYLPSAGRG
jgi:DNA-binding MurR/RpiR family transcriptional regulator